MNRDRIMKIACLLATTLLVVACTNDAYTDGNGTSLPEGMYPLTFTATQADIVASPQTRVTDSDEGGVHKSKWTAGDQIEVIVKGGDNDTKTTCTLKEDGSIDSKGPQVYWKTTKKSTINAWYSNIETHSTTSSTVSLADQSKGLAYVLKADEMTENYKSDNIPLQFKHQLAKVRVKLEKGTYEGNLSNATVKMKGCYNSCSVNDGAVTGSTTGDITMHKATYGSDTYYEANAVPGTALKGNAFEISADGKITTANLTSGITLTAATVHTVTLTINKKEPTEFTGGEINQPGDYIMAGVILEEVTLNCDNISLILDNVTSSKGIEIKRGTPTIQIKGTNNSLTEAGIVLASNANVVIQGDGSLESKLTIRNTKTVGIGVQTDGTNCGNITIKDVEVDVEVEPLSGAAAIGGTYGSGPGFGNGCGDILIENSVVRAKGGKGAAAIGFGTIAEGYEIGTITINKSEIYVTTVSRSTGDYGACIGFGSLVDPDRTQTLGLVTISTTESEDVFFGADRFKAIDEKGNEVTTGFYKVGKTTNTKMQGDQSWSGLMFKGTMLASGDASGYGYK